ncbi:M48 family metalloprotease [Sphingomonas nostoxanthinifaciens]|uniref:M48 family metalloprotease n=1 Tax=Sphingomonas nostoxanthinifaciens TaxID=2872652 RepID=UPI001CC1DC01|nr:M48 family metalloprotease [Sphingomonas nostoxanthinifaciens]UAK23978.1 M48 family metalloprotease [Sphingomonas nostoxanthinifaciens]
MHPRFRVLHLLFALVMLLVGARPALAQEVLRDAETEQFLQDISAGMAKSAGLSPGALKLVLVRDPEINAFVAGGQIIYINSGTIERADDVSELQGVIAHELGHIEGGDAVRGDAAAVTATRVTLLSLLLGAAAIAAGAPEAGMAAMMAGQSAAEGKYLAYGRQIEGSADASAVRHLNDAHLSGKGMISFFEKLKQEEYRLTPSFTKIDPYAVDHPMTDDRLAVLSVDLAKSPYWNTPIIPADQARFLRIKAKLVGYLEDPPIVINRYPLSNNSVPARYARAYAWHRGGYPQKAQEEIDNLLAQAPHDPYFLELKGQVLLESGDPKRAIPPLREAVAQSRSTPLIASLLGDALVATEDPADFKEAQQVLKVAVQRDGENPQAWYNLGLIYTRLGDEGRANLASAERYSLEGNQQRAAANAEMALRGIPVGTPDYLRAQDIALTMQDSGKKKRRR